MRPIHIENYLEELEVELQLMPLVKIKKNSFIQVLTAVKAVETTLIRCNLLKVIQRRSYFC